MVDTLLLSDNWDLTIDDGGSIAVDQTGYAIAQDVASVLRTFLGEPWYDVEQGIPYKEQILGQEYSAAQLSALMEEAALTVPDVVDARASLNEAMTGRVVSGTLKVIDTQGQELNIHF